MVDQLVNGINFPGVAICTGSSQRGGVDNVYVVGCVDGIEFLDLPVFHGELRFSICACFVTLLTRPLMETCINFSRADDEQVLGDRPTATSAATATSLEWTDCLTENGNHWTLISRNGGVQCHQACQSDGSIRSGRFIVGN